MRLPVVNKVSKETEALVDDADEIHEGFKTGMEMLSFGEERKFGDDGEMGETPLGPVLSFRLVENALGLLQRF